MKRNYLAAASVAALAFAASGARAQTMDYGSLEQLFGEPVTTSAIGSPQKATEAPATMEIVTADDIRRSGAHDIPGVLRHVAGVDVLQWTNDDADVSVRGYNQAYSPRLLVLIDGRQVYADYYGFTPWSALPVELSEIRQIEIVKGPNSALFGFNAVGGVINIVTYNPLYDDVKTAGLSVGTQSSAEGSAVATAKIGDKMGFRIGVGGRSDDDFSTPQPVNDVGTRRGDNRGEINVDGNFQLTDKIQASLEATHSQADQTEEIPVYATYWTRYGTYSVKGQVVADTPVGLIQGTAYSNWIDVIDFGTTTKTPAFTFNNQVTVVQLQDLYKIDENNTVRGSLEYRYNTVGSSFIPGAHISYDVVSGSVMWDWKILPTLTLTNALRLDSLSLGRDGPIAAGSPFTNASWDLTTTMPSYNSGLVWRPDDVDTFRITAARGVQVPNLVEYGALSVQVGPLTVGGQPTVMPTIVSNYELGWDRQIAAIGGMFRLSAYHQETDNIAALFGTLTVSPTGSLLLTSANIGNSQADGLELSLKGKIGEDWHWGLAYTPEVITDGPQAANVNKTDAETDFQHTTPVNVVKANLGWAGGKWEVDGFAQYESSFYGLAAAPGAVIGANLVPISDYLSVDGRIGYKLTDWLTLGLDAQNITQSSQQQTAGPIVERRVYGTATVIF